MYTGVLNQNWIRIFYRSIGYLIVPPSKLYEENQETIKILLADRITLQDNPLYVIITALHKIHILKTFEIVKTRSSMKLADINSKPRGEKSLRYILYRAIVVRFYPPPGSYHYKLLGIERFHVYTHRQS